MKTSELIGDALEWAVASIQYPNDTSVLEPDWYSPGVYTFSTDWAEGGPIIEQLIAEGFIAQKANFDLGFKFFRASGDLLECQYGYTVLIAAMRCYVALKLGDEVEIPKELL